MRRAAKIDANQPDIVARFREWKFSVAITSAVGQGFPDIVVGYRQLNVLVEIKDEAQPKRFRKLTPDQEKFHKQWLGPIVVVESLEDVDNLCTVIVKHQSTVFPLDVSSFKRPSSTS